MKALFHHYRSTRRKKVIPFDARFLECTTIVSLCLSCTQQSSSNHGVTSFTVTQHNTVFVELSLE